MKPTTLTSLFRWFVLPLLVLCVACGGGGGDDQNNDGSEPEGIAGLDPSSSQSGSILRQLVENSVSSKIIGGEQLPHSGSPIVLVLGADGDGIPNGLCSGTLIAPKKVLSAGHCSDMDKLIEGFDHYIVRISGKNYEVADVDAHPEYTGAIPSLYDLAIFTLAEPAPVEPMPVLLNDPIGWWEEIIVMGYGLNEETIDGGSPTNLEDLRSAKTRIELAFWGMFFSGYFRYGTAICMGDSGGPALQEVDGVQAVVGVSSIGILGCVNGSFAGYISIQEPENQEFLFAHAPEVRVR